ncbi:uncharacterized protein LOC103795192 isoform X2 [Callithrix jacchus]
MQLQRLTETEQRGKGEGGVAGRAGVRRTEGGTGREGCAPPGTCPRPPRARRRARNPAAMAAGKCEPLGMGVRPLKGHRRRTGGLCVRLGPAFWVLQSPAGAEGARELHCGKGSCMRMAAGVAGPSAAPRAAGSARDYA